MYFRGRGKGGKIASEPIVLDIETSWNHDRENPKCWIVSIQVFFLDNYYLFRSPFELIDFYKGVVERYALNPKKRVVNIIHNASFDLSYLIGFFQEFLPMENAGGVFIEKNKIVSYQQWAFEWRCTYLLTQMSLEKWTKEMNVEHQKRVGMYDYEKIVYPDTELDEQSLLYDRDDVLGLYEAFLGQLESYGDNLSTVPLTSTGYARRLFREGANKDTYYREKYFISNRLDVRSYKYCINSFSGGFTHNNRFYKSKIVDPRKLGYKSIGHRDFRSMYPSIMRAYPMATGKPELYYDVRKAFYRNNMNPTIKNIIDMAPEYSSITHLKLYEGTCIKDDKISMPLLQKSKCVKPVSFRAICDNGRILSIVSGECEMYVDNYTLDILNRQYDLEYSIIGVIRFKNEMLPKCLADVVDELFKKKSDYKMKMKEQEKLYGILDPRTQEMLFWLNLNKRLLNSCFGMFCTRPVRDEWSIDWDRLDNEDEDEREPFHMIERVRTDEQIEERLNKFYSGKNNFLAYQTGVFVTALAKHELFEYIEAIGYDKALYCDTDSIFYLKDEETEKAIEKLNAVKHASAPYITALDGSRVYYDVFEPEEDLKAFKSLHSKCYGVITEDRDELVLTVAGVPAKTIIGLGEDNKPIYLTREEEICGITPEDKLSNPNIKIENVWQGLDNLTHEFEFKVNTGTTCRYLTEKPHEEIIEGHKVWTCGGAIIIKLDAKMIKDIDTEIIETIK